MHKYMYIYNLLCLLSVVHKYMCLGLTTWDDITYQDLIPGKEWSISSIIFKSYVCVIGTGDELQREAYSIAYSIFYESYYGVPNSNQKFNFSNRYLVGTANPHNLRPRLLTSTFTHHFTLTVKYRLLIIETNTFVFAKFFWRNWKQCTGLTLKGKVLKEWFLLCHCAPLEKLSYPVEGALLVQ